LFGDEKSMLRDKLILQPLQAMVVKLEGEVE
jgi:hypothetical protein